MNGPSDQRTALLMLVGCGTGYVAFEHPSFGTAIIVGVAVVLAQCPASRDVATATRASQPGTANRSRANLINYRLPVVR